MPKRILLVSATQQEMPVLEREDVDVLVTGVGMVATTFSLTGKLTGSQYDLVMNVGIAGSFRSQFQLGQVVQVVSDRFAELGVEDHEQFIPADKMDLVDTDELLFETNERLGSLQETSGITVNRVHGAQDSIASVNRQFSPDIESMEGAAVAYVCKQFGIPWVQVRAISNRVEPRNRAAWNIPLALENLHVEVRKCIDDLRNEG